MHNSSGVFRRRRQHARGAHRARPINKFIATLASFSLVSTGLFAVVMSSTTAASAVSPNSNSTVLLQDGPPVFAEDSALNMGHGRAAHIELLVAGFPAPTCTLNEGTLPSGLTFNSSECVLEGTPTQTGTFSIDVTATNDFGTQSHAFSFGVGYLPTITGQNEHQSRINEEFRYEFTVQVGTGAARCALIGDLPAGLTFSRSMCEINGTPTSAGVFDVAITASNDYGSVSHPVRITIGAPPILAAATPPTSPVATPYSFALPLTSANPATCVVTGGALPTGLELGASSCEVTGTPQQAGHYSATITATNEYGVDERSYEFEFGTAPSFGMERPHNTATDSPLIFEVPVQSESPVTCSLEGILPDGVALDELECLLSGIPTMTGDFSFTITATNEFGAESMGYSLSVGAVPAIGSELPDGGVAGAAVAFQVPVSGTPAPTCSVSGTLPDGIHLDPDSCILSGVPTANGDFAFSVTAANEYGVASRSYELHLAPAFVVNSDTARVPATRGAVLSPLNNDTGEGLLLVAAESGLTSRDYPSDLSVADNAIHLTPDVTRPWAQGELSYEEIVTYTVRDANNAEQQGTVTVTVVRAPFVRGAELQLETDGTASGSLTSDGSAVRINPLDALGGTALASPLVLSVVPTRAQDPVSATVTVDGNDVVYTPSEGFKGVDTFRVQILDELDQSIEVLYTVTVTPKAEVKPKPSPEATQPTQTAGAQPKPSGGAPGLAVTGVDSMPLAASALAVVLLGVFGIVAATVQRRRSCAIVR